MLKPCEIKNDFNRTQNNKADYLEYIITRLNDHLYYNGAYGQGLIIDFVKKAYNCSLKYEDLKKAAEENNGSIKLLTETTAGNNEGVYFDIYLQTEKDITPLIVGKTLTHNAFKDMGGAAAVLCNELKLFIYSDISKGDA